ncbi:MAG: glycosyltransferase family 39 protein, partial [Acidobacteriota bacterium]|nr:glycosyltransferase family 39 protein [Acidobacteriota bacterium]
MPGTRNSKTSRRFKRPGDDGAGLSALYAFLCSAAVMAAAVVYFFRAGSTLYYGDAEAHLNIARRIVDSRTPGWSQIGTTWLPLPHLLAVPLVRNSWLWRTGLAGAIPAAAEMTVAATFLFASMRRIFSSVAAATAATAVFLLNPNTLYLGSIPMTEPAFFAALFALLYFTVRFAETGSWPSLAGAALAGLAGSLTRYEAWFLLPFAGLYILISGDAKRWAAILAFCLIAGTGPALWLAHNRWYFGDPLYFYRGPWSALAIQGKSNYPGKGDWRMAWQYFFAAGKLLAGRPALILGGIGTVAAAFVRRALWPIFVLALLPAFYVWSIHSSGTPIFVPTLWPHTFYNARYAMAFLPMIALGVGGLVRASGPKFDRIAAFACAAISLTPFILLTPPVTLHEAEVNSRVRRQWITETAEYLRPVAGFHETFFTSFGDLTAVYRTLGVPLADTLTGDNDVE